MSLLCVRGLDLGYERNILVKGLTFTVEKGDYLCIVGENGSGKTTLMRTLLGLVKPLSGEVLMGEGLVPSGIGYLPQQTQIQRDFPASVREIVLSGCLGKMGNRPFYGVSEKETAGRNMERLGISSLAGKSYRELSGGQQQRVLLARALCATDTMLLLDEPVTGLDPDAAKEMYDSLAELNRNGVTVVMISHDLDAAMRYATHILHIGNEVFFGTRDAYAEHLSAVRAEKEATV